MFGCNNIRLSRSVLPEGLLRYEFVRNTKTARCTPKKNNLNGTGKLDGATLVVSLTEVVAAYKILKLGSSAVTHRLV
jgi:hypothetical protein